MEYTSIVILNVSIIKNRNSKLVQSTDKGLIQLLIRIAELNSQNIIRTILKRMMIYSGRVTCRGGEFRLWEYL